LVADLTLDKAMLQDVQAKKILERWRRREVVEYLHGSYRVSVRHERRVARLNPGPFRYRSHKDPRTELRMHIREKCNELTQNETKHGDGASEFSSAGIERQQAEGEQVAFRADAAFAKTEIYEAL
jgi:hypothetical protein